MRIGKLAKVWATAALTAVSIAAMSLPAQAESLWIDYQTTDADIATINQLMTPIRPLTGGPGSNSIVNQVGTSNASTASIVGSGNLTLVQQTGSNNRAAQIVEGSNSAAVLWQGGSDNTVFQGSQGDRNFQLVAVSGSGNDVAYMQVGNDLAGALDVTNSTNSSVFALQTPSTSNYMMPSGLRGLTNQVVIVVPGRMYVIPKSAF
jgi:hypothetical protein